jgi:hypothetical protein
MNSTINKMKKVDLRKFILDNPTMRCDDISNKTKYSISHARGVRASLGLPPFRRGDDLSPVSSKPTVVDKTDKELMKIFGKMSKEEKALILKGMGKDSKIKAHDHTWSTNHIRFGYFSDSHMGHNKFSEELWWKMVSFFKKEKITTVYSPGDIVEGMSGRPGHIYELDHIGFDAQVNYAAKLINACPFQIYSIVGNHDLWYKEKFNMNAGVGEVLQDKCKNFHFLGEWEADVILAPNVKMKIFHANDGSAYALSYKIQKLIESFTGGEKPSIVLSGHYHKQIQVFLRNVFGFECGTLCGQSIFMRGKKISAHMGFGVIDIWVNADGIERLRHEFIPHFEK